MFIGSSLVVAACVAVFVPCAANAESLSRPLSGPTDPDQAGYAHLSFVNHRLPERYELHYELCNRKKDNLAFRWAEAGFEMLARKPLAPFRCALYEKSTLAYRENSTNLKFSDRTVPADAYVACDPKKENCPKVVENFSASARAELSAIVHGPTAEVWPINISTLVRPRGDGSSDIIVTWAAKNSRFLLGFPGSKSDVLKSEIKGNVSTFYSYFQFPELQGSPFLPDGAEFFEVGNTNDSDVGRWSAVISPKMPLGPAAVVLVLDGDTKLAAIISAPLPQRAPR